MRGRYARRGHHENIERNVLTAVEEPVDPVGAEHVGDLVGISDHGGRAMSQNRARELVDHELGRLDVHVGVDKPGY